MDIIGAGSLRRAVVAAALAGALVAALAGPATAFSPLPITCTAAGTVTTVPGSPDIWSLSGSGSCQGDLEGTYFLSFAGSGTSQGLGLCPAPPGDILVTNLDIGIAGTRTNAATMIPVAFTEKWVAPATTYPIAMPFVVERDGSPIGAGVAFNHIFLNCQGSPVAQFTWTELT